jgi:hypothetical protein
MLPYMPIGQERVLTEHKFLLPTANGLPPWLGYIDLLDDSRTLTEFLRVLDYKSLSDFRYAKTPEELRKNTQVVCYARAVFEGGHDEEYVQVGHLYIKTAKKTPRKPKCLLRTVEVTREEVNAVWEKDLEIVSLCVEAAQETNADRLPAPDDPGACNMYGGCPHRARCGLTHAAPLARAFGNRKKNGKGNDMADSFLEKMRKAKGVSTPAPASEPASEAEGNKGVLASDATGRTTPVETSAPEPEPAKTKKTRKTRTKKTNGTGFALYIDCMPTKDVDSNIDPTLFEDWINPICMSLNESVQKEKSLPDYRLLPYAEEKAMFALAVKEGLSEMPETMVINSSTPGAKDAMGVLIPHATKVVRALRG